MTGHSEAFSENYMDIVLQGINPSKKKKIVAIKQEVGERVGVLGEGLLEGKGRRLLHSSSVNAEGVAIVNIFQIS